MQSIKDKKSLDRYVHEPHLVPDYHGRQGNFTLLNTWGEQKAKVIIVNGIEGQGKSTLVAHWLKYHRIPQLVQLPVFYWSFCENEDLSEFDWELLAYSKRFIPIMERNKGVIQFPLIKAAQERPFILVLDGLERLYRKDDPAHNRKGLDPAMQFFLNMWMRYQHKGLLVITSRFGLYQLSQNSGVFNLYLSPLTPSEGANLLLSLNVSGNNAMLAEYSSCLQGHPLSLKIMAGIVSQYCYGKIENFASKHIIRRDMDDKISDNFTRLCRHS